MEKSCIHGRWPLIHGGQYRRVCCIVYVGLANYIGLKGESFNTPSRCVYPGILRVLDPMAHLILPFPCNSVPPLHPSLAYPSFPSYNCSLLRPKKPTALPFHRVWEREKCYGCACLPAGLPVAYITREGFGCRVYRQLDTVKVFLDTIVHSHLLLPLQFQLLLPIPSILPPQNVCPSNVLPWTSDTQHFYI